MSSLKFALRGPARSARFSKHFVGTLAFASCFLFAACHRTSGAGSTVMLNYEIMPSPARVGPAEIAVTLKIVNAEVVTAARVTLEADMAHPGMAPVFAQAKETAPGKYVGNLNFTMPGDWVILAHVTLPDGSKVERQIELSGIEAK